MRMSDLFKKEGAVKKKRLGFLCCLLWMGIVPVFSQEIIPGQLSGNLQSNAKFFLRDSLIGAANTPQYDHQLYGAEAWLNLNYRVQGFDAGLRFDIFHQSNLLNPSDSYSAEGIGNWFVRKSIDKLDVHAGYIYDQIGSGIIFRAYEERAQLIDNALVGLKLNYAIHPDWQIRAFTGRQKQQFDRYRAVIRGLALDGFLSGGTGRSAWSSAPGMGMVARTLDDLSMNNLVATLNTYRSEDAFVPRYNAYAFTAFNTLTIGNITWYAEGAYKSREALIDPYAQTVTGADTVVGERYVNHRGSVLYTTLSYSRNRLGLTLEAKRTEGFSFRTRPQEQLNRGMIHFLPPMSRVNTYRLTSRYNAATQELGEWAFQGDMRLRPGNKWRININASHITRLNRELLYGELYAEIQYKANRRTTISGGIQRQQYNQEVYETKPGVGYVRTLTPFAEVLVKGKERGSWRAEAQYMHTGFDKSVDARQDYGNWMFALAEWNVTSAWTLSVSDMYNVAPGRNSPRDGSGNTRALHFPRADIFYRIHTNTFSLSYVKQVEGVVCTGGICRLEPAFSGVKFTLNSSF